jgi:hypothetical protein
MGKYLFNYDERCSCRLHEKDQMRQSREGGEISSKRAHDKGERFELRNSVNYADEAASD